MKSLLKNQGLISEDEPAIRDYISLGETTPQMTKTMFEFGFLEVEWEYRYLRRNRTTDPSRFLRSLPIFYVSHIQSDNSLSSFGNI